MQWVTHTPEGSFPVVCSGEHYANMIRSQGGEEALRQWKLLEDKMQPLQQGAALFPAAALRSDPGMSACNLHRNEKKRKEKKRKAYAVRRFIMS